MKDNIITNIDFKKVVDTLPFGLGIVSSDGLYLYCNQAYTDETGVQPENIIGRNVKDIADEGVYFTNPSSLQVLKSKSKVATVSTDNAYGTHKISFTIGVPVYDDNDHVQYAVTSLFNTDMMHGFYKEFKKSQEKIDDVRIINGASELPNQHLVSKSSSMDNVLMLAKRVAMTDANILIIGESGVGKEVISDYIYENSKRSGKPFIKINCAAIPKELLESELFGYEPGAFTGASPKGKIGLIEAADGGTVMLDEIGEMPMEIQPKLLRFIQQGTFSKVGSHIEKKVNVRIISATNADLKASVANGTFRDDLFYRISVFPISIPPLRERPEDIRAISDHYFEIYCKEYDKSVLVPNYIYEMLENYSWPGNIRELQNVIEYLVICCDDKDFIDKNILQTTFAAPVLEDVFPKGNINEVINEYEKKIIIRVLRNSSSLREAARILGIAPSSLLRKAEKYKIDTQEIINGTKKNEVTKHGKI